MLIGPMRMLGIALGMAQRATASGARVFQILDREPQMTVAGGRAGAAGGTGRVELRDVTLRYGDEHEPALRDVVADGGGRAPRSRWWERTGSGKTSLVGADPAALRRRRRAQVLVDGADVRTVDPTSLRQAIALVTDDPFLFSATVHENIAYARPDATREEVGAGGAARPGRRLHLRAARRLRHAHRRAGADAVGRPAPAPGDRAGAAGRPAHPDPRRRDLLGGRLHRAGDQGGAARGDGGADDVRDRPPPLDHRAGRRDRRARARRDRCAGRHDELRGGLASCTARSWRRACPTRCSSPRSRVEREVAGL